MYTSWTFLSLSFWLPSKNQNAVNGLNQCGFLERACVIQRDAVASRVRLGACVVRTTIVINCLIVKDEGQTNQEIQLLHPMIHSNLHQILFKTQTLSSKYSSVALLLFFLNQGLYSLTYPCAIFCKKFNHSGLGLLCYTTKVRTGSVAFKSIYVV